MTPDYHDYAAPCEQDCQVVKGSARWQRTRTASIDHVLRWTFGWICQKSIAGHVRFMLSRPRPAISLSERHRVRTVDYRRIALAAALVGVSNANLIKLVYLTGDW